MQLTRLVVAISVTLLGTACAKKSSLPLRTNQESGFSSKTSPRVGATVPSTDPEIEKSLQTALDISDGSHIIGSISNGSLSFHTTFTEMDIPIALIRTVHFKDHHETARIVFQNGDTISGVVAHDSFLMTTVFGEFTIGLEHVAQLDHLVITYLKCG